MKISIITINYNDKEGLDKTIQSVISQTYSDYEFIIIDGGSTDGSVDVIKKYEKHLHYWVSEKDKGIYNAMNKGILVANGKYLHFLNSGDYYCDKNVVEDIFFKIALREVDIVRGNYKIIENNESIIKTNFGIEGLTLSGFRTQSYCHQALFLKKDLFSRYGLYDESLKICSDWKHLIISLFNNSTQFYIDRCIAVYDTNGISSNTTITSQEFEKTWKEIVPCFINQDIANLERMKLQLFEFHQNPLINFLLNNKLPNFILRCLRKIYIILGI